LGHIIFNGQITDHHRAQRTTLQSYQVILTIGVVMK